MPTLVQAFTITAWEAAHILERRVPIKNSLTNSLIEFVIECGSTSDIILMIGRCKGHQLTRAMNVIDPHMSTSDRIRCLQRVHAGVYSSRVRDRLLTAILKSPMERWFGEEARNVWECDVLSTPEIDRMVQRVLEKDVPLWAVCMSRFEVRRCGTTAPFLTEQQRGMLAALAAKDKSARW